MVFYFKDPQVPRTPRPRTLTAIFPDHLEVTVNGAPRLNVTLDEVGLKGGWWQFVCVGGGI